MEIVPVRIFWMVIASVIFGAAMGIVNDVNRCIRCFLGVNYIKREGFSLEEMRLPIINRALGQIKKSKFKRRLLPVIIFLQDILFFLLGGAGVAILDYYFNNGRARIYTPVAVTVGFFAYFLTLGRLSPYLFRYIVFCLRAVCVIALAVIYRPIRGFVVFLGIFVKKIRINVKKTIAKRQKMVYNNKKKRHAMRNAAEGFLSFAENKFGGT